jgi:hypothetical protein
VTESRVWTWKNTRSVKISVSLFICPWDWFISYAKYTDYELCNTRLQIGPFYLSFEFTIGNSSAEGWRGKFGLSECEAWDRSKIKPSS